MRLVTGGPRGGFEAAAVVLHGQAERPALDQETDDDVARFSVADRVDHRFARNSQKLTFDVLGARACRTRDCDVEMNALGNQRTDAVGQGLTQDAGLRRPRAEIPD